MLLEVVRRETLPYQIDIHWHKAGASTSFPAFHLGNLSTFKVHDGSGGHIAPLKDFMHSKYNKVKKRKENPTKWHTTVVPRSQGNGKLHLVI